MTLIASFQGTRLSASDRRRLQQQQQVRGFFSHHLEQVVEQTLAKVDQLKEQGVRPENPNRFTLEYTANGTPWLGDVFGFDCAPNL